MTAFSKKVIFIFLILFLPLMVFPQEGKILKQILKKGELRIGTTGVQPPFSMKSKEGKLMGYDIELAKLLTNALKLKATFVEKPFSELLPALEKKEVDIVMSGMTITPERNLKFVFVGPYMISGKSILAKSKRMANLNENGEINRNTVTVVTLEGTTSTEFVENNLPEANLVGTKDYEKAVKMIIEDKADLMIADYPICVLSVFMIN